MVDKSTTSGRSDPSASDGGLVFRTIESARYRKERGWRKLLAFSHTRPTEPFKFLSRGRQLFDVVTVSLLVALIVVACMSQVRAGQQRHRRIEAIWRSKYAVLDNVNVTEVEQFEVLKEDPWYMNKSRAEDHPFYTSCLVFWYGRNRAKSADMRVLDTLWLTVLELFITVAATGTIHGVILLLSSIQSDYVFPTRKLEFKWKRRLMDPATEKYRIAYSKFYLQPTVQALRQCVQGVREGKVAQDAPTRFLLSSYGRLFLNRAAVRVHSSLQLYNDELVRRHRRGAYMFFFISVICVSVSLTASYDDSGASDVCNYRVLVLAFLEKFSFTLLAAFAVASFAGISQYSQLICVRERLCRLTDDEKFLISLLAANSDLPFRGVSQSESSGYAKIVEPGEAEVFIPIHSSLFAYKPARTLQEGEDRMWNDNAPDNPGNYNMH